MSTELKKCPFCGGQPRGPTYRGGDDERMGYNFTVTISCSCGIAMSKGSHYDKLGWCDDTGQAQAEAIKAWNSRMDTAQ